MHQNRVNIAKILTSFISSFQTQVLSTKANRIHILSFSFIILFHIVEQTDTLH